MDLKNYGSFGKLNSASMFVMNLDLFWSRKPCGSPHFGKHRFKDYPILSVELQLIPTDIVLQMVVQAKPLQTLIRLRVIDQDKQAIVQMLSFGVFAKGGDLHNPFNSWITLDFDTHLGK